MCEHCKANESKTATIYSEKNIEDENINNAIIELGYKITSIKE